MVHPSKDKKPSAVQRRQSQDWVIARPSDTLPSLRKSAPWMNDPKWFRSVVVSPSAVVKMLAHCDSGVTKGIAKGGNPIEVMGMLLGRPTDDHQLVITDAFPLPIEGFETRVVADDQAVVNHMIALGESLERTRCEKFMGWYHSHPFELSQDSHCFLSQTDLSTQLQWQRAEDAHGNPFVAIVVDPLRTRHLQEPVLKAFRAYPPEYAPNSPNECPNGAIEHSEQVRLERWGSCWNRYYELAVDYRMTPACRRILEQLTSDSIWIRNLSSTSSNRGSSSSSSALSNPSADAARLRALTDQCRSAHNALGLAATAAAAAASARAPTSSSIAAGSGGPAGSLTTGGAAATAGRMPTRSAASQWRGEAPAAGLTASTTATGGTYARSEEAMAALTVDPPSSQQQQPQQLPGGSVASTSGAAAAGTGAGAGAGLAPASGTTSSGAAQWAKAVRAVVDAAEDVVCNEHRNATKGRVFG